MMKEPDLDPPRPGDRKRTYYDRRAAMYFGGAEALREARNRAFRALARRDRAACLVAVEDLATRSSPIRVMTTGPDRSQEPGLETIVSEPNSSRS
jgi:hypothetical protein